MIADSSWQVETATSGVADTLASAFVSDLERRVLRTNRSLQEATSYFRGNVAAGRKLVLHLLKEFADTALALESCGWPAARIRDELRPSRGVFATSSFIGSAAQEQAEAPVAGNRPRRNEKQG